MHSAQYLWITRYFAKRDAEQAARAGGWSPWRYWATLVAGGAALFLPVPWLASYGWHVDFTASIFIVAAIVNLHHFMIDGVVWKLRNPRVGRVLVQADATAADAAPARRGAAPADAAPARRPALTWAWRVGARRRRSPRLAAVDQWRYVLAIGHGERDRLAEAARLNPYDSGTYLRLAQAESAAGDPAAAAAALRRAVDANPQNPVLAQALVRRLIEADQFAEAYRATPGAAGALARRRRRAGERRRPRRSAGRRRRRGAVVDRRRSPAIRRSAASTCISPSASTRAARPATRCPTTGATSSWRRGPPRTTGPHPREVVADRRQVRRRARPRRPGRRRAHAVRSGDQDGRPDRARRPRRARRRATARDRRARPSPALAPAHVDRSRLRQNRPPSTRKLCAVQAPPSSAARNSTICANSSA